MIAVPRARCGGGAAFNVLLEVVFIRGAESTREIPYVKSAFGAAMRRHDLNRLQDGPNSGSPCAILGAGR